MATGGAVGAGARGGLPGDWASRLVAVVQGAAKRAGPLRRCRARLALDLAVLLSGARPTLMLDYAHRLDLEGAVQLALHASEALGVRWCVLTHGDCHYIACTASLLAHLDALLHTPATGPSPPPATGPSLDGCSEEAGSSTQHSPAPPPQPLPVALVGFARAGSAGLEPTVLPQQDAQALLRGLARLRDTLASSPGVPLLTAAGRAQPLVVVDLAAACAPLLLPTLNGLLLAYPVVYCVHDREGASAAARCLSGQHLDLHRAVAAPPPALAAAVAALRQGDGGNNSNSGGGSAADAVCAFTVPACLCAASETQGGGCSVASRVEEWGRRMQQALEAAGWSGVACVAAAVGSGCAVSL